MTTTPERYLILDVTAALIAEGVRADCYHCPFALAGHHAVPGATRVQAGHLGIRFYLPCSIFGLWFPDLPKAMVAWMRAFDAGKPVSLIRVEVPLIVEQYDYLTPHAAPGHLHPVPSKETSS